MNDIKGELTLRGVIVGCVGCIIITVASVYTALKMGALPWPIVFAALVSLFFLKALSRGNASLNEANVTHTIMSAGAMVAGGLAFTIPGAWMLGFADSIGWVEMLVTALAGVTLGLICTAMLRKHFVEDAELEFPIGESAAQTLIAGNAGGKAGVKLFASIGLAGAYTALRDIAGVIPSMLLSGLSIPGVAFGIYNSPMLLAVGFLVGTGAVLAWFAGAVFANFGIILGGTTLGFWDATTAQSIVSSLGMGAMMGAGIGVICKNILPKAMKTISAIRPGTASTDTSRSKSEETDCQSSNIARTNRRRITAGVAACAIAAVALVLCFILRLNPLATIITVLLTWVATAMSAQSVGQTGIDPMEIFGLIVLLAVAAFSNTAQVQLFFVAGVVAVACGLAGDVMNDFHAGHVLGTSPRAQWLGQAVGAILGAIVAVVAMTVLVAAYGPESFGPGTEFVSAQASVVATMVSGIPCVPAFAIGLVAGVILHFANLPAMMLGLGIYLPFYLSFTAFLGTLVKLAYDAICRQRAESAPDDERMAKKAAQEQNGLIVSSGLLGGESIVGVIAAIATLLCA